MLRGGNTAWKAGEPMTTTQSTVATSATASWLGSKELQTLEAICDALIPALAPPTGESDPHGYWRRSARDLNVAALMVEALAPESPDMHRQFRQLLRLLDSPVLGVMVMGRPQRIARLPLAAREAALLRMSRSPMERLRQGFQAIKRLAEFVYFSAPVENGANPNWPALGYTPAPPPPSPEAAPKRIQPLPITGDLTLTADAVVIGSGAGGGVVAAELAAAGKDVIVIEKGGYYNEADFTGSEADMTPKLYLRRGTLSTRDLGMVVLAGSCLGGGTTVNWSTSLRTPDDVLEEWEREYGFTGATSADYQRGFDVAERRIGVNVNDSEPNANNAALMRGCEALGYSWKPIPRNASDCQQRCGACGFGCPHGRKQSTMLTFLQDAHDHGARFLVNCSVERVVIEAGRVTGVIAWAPDATGTGRHRVIVRAPTVVVSGGSVESPAVLLRSALDNPNIGRHLRLHPVAIMQAFYEQPIEPWTGSLQTVMADHFARLRGGYGIRFEVMPAHPGLIALGTPWEGGAAHKGEMLGLRHSAAMIALTRDTGEGRVSLDSQSEPVLDYWPNETDRAHLVRGMQELTRIAFAGGAVRAATLHTQRLALESEGGKPGAVDSARLARFMDEIARGGVVKNRILVGTAHQMGTCRLGSGPQTAVADPTGQVFGARGLYIADASGFPTASGVNPMLSTMALAYHVAQQIKAAS